MLGRSFLAYRKNLRLLLVPADTYPTPTLVGCSPSSGTHLGGTSLTLTGTGFMFPSGSSCVESISFGSATTSIVTPAASFTVVSDTQITAVTPAHSAGASTIVLKTSGGCAVLGNGFTFT